MHVMHAHFQLASGLSPLQLCYHDSLLSFDCIILLCRKRKVTHKRRSIGVIYSGDPQYHGSRDWLIFSGHTLSVYITFQSVTSLSSEDALCLPTAYVQALLSTGLHVAWSSWVNLVWSLSWWPWTCATVLSASALWRARLQSFILFWTSSLSLTNATLYLTLEHERGYALCAWKHILLTDIHISKH